MKAQFRYAIDFDWKNRLKMDCLSLMYFLFETTCPQCGIVCRQQESVEQHMKTVHEGRM